MACADCVCRLDVYKRQQDSYDVLLGSYKLAEDNFNIVNAKYEQGAVSEYDKISAEVQMRSIKPNVISAANGVTLAKLQLKVLMGITADAELKTEDSLTNYEKMCIRDRLFIYRPEVLQRNAVSSLI